jgi:diguanylate cyclase (GGDEF)-like protein
MFYVEAGNLIMFFNTKFAMKFILIYILLFYTWLLLFQDHAVLRLYGAGVFPLVGGAVSFLWLFHAYRASKNHQKMFWLLLSIGVFIYLTASTVWFITNVLLGIYSYPGPADLLWISAYLTLLAALLFRVSALRYSMSQRPLYNILMLMTVASALSIYYLINPLLIQAEGSLAITFLTIAYPLLDIVILFAAISLYYLAQYSRQRKVLLLIAVGFTLQIIADTVLVYLSILGMYVSGHPIEPLWQGCLLLCGLAGLYEIKSKKEHKEEGIHKMMPLYNVFPYLCITLLLYMVMHSHGFKLNALSIGLSIVMLLTIMRQLSTLSENARLMNEYKQLAYCDTITGLNNRARFKKDLEVVLAEAQEHQATIGLMLIDLDRFKNINDTLGHPVGDALLKVFAERLIELVQYPGQVYRIGGDEFVLLIPNTSAAGCASIAEELIQAMDKPFRIEGWEIIISPSIGISLFPENGDQPEQLFKYADAAMYYAKEQGKNNYKFYTAELNDEVTRKGTLEYGLRKALEENQFMLVYQAKVDLNTNQIVGVEALLRWNHPKYGVISPMEFIPLAEETGQIVDIGQWVLRMACQQNKQWQEAGLPQISISVNVSIRQFQNHQFANIVRGILEETKLSPQFLELEVTESVLHHASESIGILNELSAMGVGISLDDFGTGYSSMNILRKLPFNTIKIDKSFIDEITTTAASQSIVRAIIEMGIHLDINIVAEGIEHDQQIEFLRQHRCGIGQGYIFEKPMGPRSFEQLLVRGLTIGSAGSDE